MQSISDNSQLPITNYQLPITLRVSPAPGDASLTQQRVGETNAICFNAGNPRNAMAPQDRAVSPITNSPFFNLVSGYNSVFFKLQQAQ